MPSSLLFYHAFSKCNPDIDVLLMDDLENQWECAAIVPDMKYTPVLAPVLVN
jgi:hypothetical protein